MLMVHLCALHSFHIIFKVRFLGGAVADLAAAPMSWKNCCAILRCSLPRIHHHGTQSQTPGKQKPTAKFRRSFVFSRPVWVRRVGVRVASLYQCAPQSRAIHVCVAFLCCGLSIVFQQYLDPSCCPMAALTTPLSTYSCGVDGSISGGDTKRRRRADTEDTQTIRRKQSQKTERGHTGARLWEGNARTC